MSTETILDRSQPPKKGETRPFDFPEITRRTLSNGLPVYHAPSEGFGVVTMTVLVDAGGVHDGEGRAGLSTLAASLLESGAGDRSAAEIAEELERLGLQLGTGSAWDAVQVELTGLTATLEHGSEVLADLVRRPAFPEQEVERIRNEQIAGILQRRSEPRGLANELAGRFIYADSSPFARPLGGTRESVEGLTRSDVERFHADRFAAGDTAVVVAGDITAEDALDLAERRFGDWGGAPAAEGAISTEGRFDATRVIIVDRPGAVQSELRVGHVGVARDAEDYFPLIVMNAILGGAFSSRLNMSLRERHGFTYGVSSSFVMRRKAGPFLISTAVQTEVTARALEETFAELRGIRASAVERAEIVDARNYLAGTFPLRLQTTAGLASRLAELAVHRLPLDYFDSYRERIMEVTEEDVLRVATQHLRPDQATVVVVGDARAVRPGIEALGLGAVTVVDAEGNE